MRIRNWHKFQHFKDRRPPWIKLYRDLLDDPDWHELDGDTAKFLVMLWLIASEDDGNLPDSRKLAFRLRIKEDKVKQLLNSLSKWLEQGDAETISDRCHDDAPETETETETETEKKDIVRKENETEKITDEFEVWYGTYPKHVGRGAALRAYRKARKDVDQSALLTSARAFGNKCLGSSVDPKFIPHPATWLNGEHWLDEDLQPPKPQELISNGQVYVQYGTDPGDAWEDDYRKRGKVPPGSGSGGYWFPTEYPSRETSEQAA